MFDLWNEQKPFPSKEHPFYLKELLLDYGYSDVRYLVIFLMSLSWISQMTWAFKELTVIAANDKIQVKVKILKKKKAFRSVSFIVSQYKDFLLLRSSDINKYNLFDTV